MAERHHYHVMGVAGTGMSAIAHLLVDQGHVVSGCDPQANALTAELMARGATIRRGHDPAHLDGVDSLVMSSAVRPQEPEVEAARARGIPVLKRDDLWREWSRRKPALAIAGTHGKTTTTVMTTEALTAAGLEPTGVAGGRVGAWQGNLRAGADRLFVVEADEYDRSFLALSPTVATVTNIEADHLDIYADLADIRRAFTQYIESARTVVLCADDPGAATLSIRTGAEVLRYGLNSPDARLVACRVRSTDGGTSFEAAFDGESVAEVRLRVPGLHNVQNALAAIASGLAVGASAERMALGLERFTGVERRFQRVGDAAGVTIVDDYAHHPTEIRATLAAARSAFPGRRVVAAFQPHLYSRTRDFAADFGAALAAADAVFLTEIYPARERPIEGISAGIIERAIRACGGALMWRGERTELALALSRSVRAGDVVLTIGAGDITRTAPELLARLTEAT